MNVIVLDQAIGFLYGQITISGGKKLQPLAREKIGHGWLAARGAQCAQIDIGALRAARRKPAMTNFLARQRLELFAATYSDLSVQKADGLIQNNAIQSPDRDYFLRTQEETIERMIKDGLI